VVATPTPPPVVVDAGPLETVEPEPKVKKPKKPKLLLDP
jgi:hypothetical protein